MLRRRSYATRPVPQMQATYVYLQICTCVWIKL